MIQRRQTLYFIFAIVLLAVMFTLRLGYITVPDAPTGSIDLMAVNYYPLIVLAGLSIITSLVSIFSFKKLALQLRMSIVNIVLLLGLIGMEIYMFFVFYDIPINEGDVRGVSVAAAFPVIALIFGYLAFKGVSRDIFRLKSYNRMR